MPGERKLTQYIFTDSEKKASSVALKGKEDVLGCIEVLASEEILSKCPETLAACSIPSNEKLGLNSHYGNLGFLYWIWKNSTSDYVGFSLNDTLLPKAALNSFTGEAAKEPGIVIPHSFYVGHPIREHYRRSFYDEDYMAMLHVLSEKAPAYAKFAIGQYNVEGQMFTPVCIMKRKSLDSFCSWLFPILDSCNKLLHPKRSKHQDSYLQHLGYYLFNLYISFNKEKINLAEAKEEAVSAFDIADSTDKKTTVSAKDFEDAFSKGHIEEALSFLSSDSLKKDPKYDDYKGIMDAFEKQRHYSNKTLIDNNLSLDKIIQGSANSIKKKKTADVLIFQWKSITNEEAGYAFEKMGLTYEYLEIGFDDWCYDEYMLYKLKKHLSTHSYNMAFSINYFGMLAEACYYFGIPYISWCYDSPTFFGDEFYCRRENVNVFMFDSREADNYNNMGLKNVHYMPLGTNISRVSKLIPSAEDHKNFDADVAFVGQLYSTSFTDSLSSLTDYQKAYINALVDYQQSSFTHDYLIEFLTEDFMKFLSNPEFNKAINSEWDHKNISDASASADRLRVLLNKLVTNRDRVLIISLLSKYYKFNLYSPSVSELFTNVNHKGYIEYYEEMPKMFKCSKINLNITFRAIRVGIPQRCIDIMGAGAVLLTNHQKDMDGFLTDGVNALIYDSVEEAYEKAKFYLENESKRIKIAENALDFATKNFDYPVQLKKMMTIAHLDHLIH